MSYFRSNNEFFVTDFAILSVRNDEVTPINELRIEPITGNRAPRLTRRLIYVERVYRG